MLVSGAVDWTAIIIAIIGTGALGAIGVATQKVVSLMYREMVTKPREDLETLKRQLAAKDDIVQTNALALDRVAETNERMIGLVGEMVESWESSRKDYRELSARIGRMLNAVPPHPGDGGTDSSPRVVSPVAVRRRLARRPTIPNPSNTPTE